MRLVIKKELKIGEGDGYNPRNEGPLGLFVIGLEFNACLTNAPQLSGFHKFKNDFILINQ